MSKLLSYLFTLRHDYRDPVENVRARALLPFTSGVAIMLLGYFLVTLLDVMPQERASIREYALVVLAVAWLGAVISAWLIQYGHLGVSKLIIGVILFGYHAMDVLVSGSMTTGIIFPMLIIFAALAFGTRGAGLAYVYGLVALGAMYGIRSEALLGTDPIDNLGSIVTYSSVNMTAAALLMLLFTRSLESALVHANRIATQTRTTAEAGQTLARILNMDELLTRAVDLIRDRFAFYYVQIFVADGARAYANLAAGTGDIGQALLAQGFRVPIGPRTVVGDVIATGQTVYIPDLAMTAYRRLDMLPDTRTQLTLPLSAGDEIVGALDIHSLRANAFGSEDIESVRIMANLVSQAIQNARLFEAQQKSLLQNRRLFLESETNLREIERLNRQLTGHSWQEYMLEQDTSQFAAQVVGGELQPGPVEWTPAMQQTIDRRRLVIQKSEDDSQVLAVPITIRGEPVGAIEVQLSGEQSQTEVRHVLQAVSERMAFSLENVRLFDQARSAAERELQINTIAAQLQGLTTVEDVLATAINTLGEALGADSGMIRLVNVDALAAPETSSNGHGGHNGHRRQGAPAGDDVSGDAHTLPPPDLDDLTGAGDDSRPDEQDDTP